MNEQLLTRALYRGGLFVVAMVALVLVGVQLKWVLVQLFAAAIMAAAVTPTINALTDPRRSAPWRWRPPPAFVVLLIYVALGLVLLVIGSILVRLMLDETARLARRAPELAAMLNDWHIYVVSRWSPLQEVDPWDVLGGTSALTQWLLDATGQVRSVAGLLVESFGGALNVIFVLFIALYLTVDARSMRDYLLVFLPVQRRERARRILAHISSRLGQWVVGQLIVCVIVGIGAGVVLGLLGVPGAAPLALVWAVSVVIPGIGPFLSAAPTILLGFAAGPTTGVVATLFAFVWSQLENNVFIPRVMGHAVKLNAMVVLVSVLVGLELLGLAGALFAVPVSAALAVVVDELHDEEHERKLKPLHAELVKLQLWAKHTGMRVVVIFEGRDAAGKGGVIKAITQRVSPRVFRIVALPAPSDREKSQSTSSGISSICRRPERSWLSIAAGTTAPASSASWASAPMSSTVRSWRTARCSSA